MPGEPDEEPGFIKLMTMKQRWQIVQWHGVLTPIDTYGSVWLWTYSTQDLGSITIERKGKPPRLCRVGDIVIMNMVTGEFVRDLEYLPIIK